MREGFAPERIDFNVRGLSFRSLYRVSLFFCQLLVFLSTHAVISLLFSGKTRLKIIVASNAFHARLLLSYLGVEIFHEKSEVKVKGRLIVCNHLSYVDVLVLFAHYPSLFITSKDIGRTFLLGQITRMAGCFFVERNKKIRSEETMFQELEEMKLRLAEGFNVFLFPEGTSSDGSSVLPFKAHFFQLATSGNISIQPLVIRYHGVTRKHVPWYGEMNFLPHFLALTDKQNISASLTQLPEIYPGNQNHFQMKDMVYENIRNTYETN